MVILAFALPDESRGVVAALQSRVWSGSAALPMISGRYEGREVTVLHTGMGAASTREQLQRFWETHRATPDDVVLGAGFAGGLDPALPSGALILAENYPEKLESASRILGHRARIGPLVSVPAPLETPQAKAQCAGETGALAADMESATGAAFFREKGVPFLVLRAISDAASEPLPIASDVWFDASAQRPRPWALLGFLLCHPGKMRPFVQFVRTLHRARRTLTAALLHLIGAL